MSSGHRVVCDPLWVVVPGCDSLAEVGTAVCPASVEEIAIEK